MNMVYNGLRKEKEIEVRKMMGAAKRRKVKLRMKSEESSSSTRRWPDEA